MYASKKSIALAVFYVGGVALVAGYVALVFGPGPAGSITAVLAVPVGLAAWLRKHSTTLSRRDRVFLLGSVLASLAASAFIVHAWFDAQMDVRHAEDVRAARLERDLRLDPAFRHVELFVCGKHFFCFKGRIDSETDLARLRALAHAHNLKVAELLEIQANERRSNDK